MKRLKTLRQTLFAPVTIVPEIVSVTYFPSLDGLRGIAVLTVIAYHFGLNHYLKTWHILINGDLGVNIFFVISGFLITTLLLKEKLASGTISLRRFYLRRALRILPVAYLFLIVLLGLNRYCHFKIPPSGFLASFFFYKNIPYQFEPYSGHFWSLAAEVQFYLIFPFLLSFSINKYLILVLSIVIVTPVVALLGYYHVGFLLANPYVQLVTKIVMYSFWNGPYIILLGSLFSLLLFKGIIKVDITKSRYFLSPILLIVAVTLDTKTFVLYHKYVSEFLSAVLIAWTILLNLARKNFLSAILEHPVLVKVGVISYSLYVWQELFVGTKAWQPWMHAFQTYPAWLFMIIKLVMLFVIAFASYCFIELRFLKMKKKAA